MTKQITFSNKTFWRWINGIVKNDINVNYFDKMIEVEYYATVRKIRDSSENRISIFQKLKEAMPPNYFQEMEYCALAYSVVFGKVFPPLTQHIEQLAYIEWLLYVEPENLAYRDHFVHMLKVAFICDEIFNKVLNKDMIKWQFDSTDPHFKEWVKEKKVYFNEGKKEDIVKAAIFLAAIFHDFGYGYKFVRGYEEKLFKLNLLGCDSVDITKSRNEVINKSLLARFIIEHHEWYRQTRKNFEKKPDEELEKIRRENIPCGFIHDCLPLNHSMASALMVLDIAEDLFQSQIITPELYIAFQIAAEACLLHDLTDPKKYLHLSHISDEHGHFLDYNCHQKTPVATLLIFADELAIWGRPSISFEKNNNDVLKIKIHHRWKENQEYPKMIKIKFSNGNSPTLNISLKNETQNKLLKQILKSCRCFSKEADDLLRMFDYQVGFN